MRIAVTGHRDLDGPTAAKVELALCALLRSLVQNSTHDLVGISCLAAGADQIFARTVLALGGRLEVVLPSSGYAGTLTGPDREAFDGLRRRADITRTLAHGHPDPDSYWQAGLHMLDSADLLVAVWDGGAPRGRGGTAEIAEYARGWMPVRVVWPEGAARVIAGRRSVPWRRP
jgi:hypothetical protein